MFFQIAFIIDKGLGPRFANIIYPVPFTVKEELSLMLVPDWCFSRFPN